MSDHHPNHVPTHSPSSEQLDRMFANSEERAAAERAAAQRAKAWPGNVDDLLATLAKRSKAQADALGEIHVRLAAIEADMAARRA